MKFTVLLLSFLALLVLAANPANTANTAVTPNANASNIADPATKNATGGSGNKEESFIKTHKKWFIIGAIVVGVCIIAGILFAVLK